MEKLPKIPLFEIAVKLPTSDLLNLCQTNKKFYELCQNNQFWKYRAVKVLGYDYNKLPDNVDQDWYMNLEYEYENKNRYASEINKLPNQALFNIAVKLPISDLLNLCQTNFKFINYVKLINFGKIGQPKF